MKIQRRVFEIALVTLAAVAGLGLGYAQDNLTQTSGGPGSAALVLLYVGISGWIAVMTWLGVNRDDHRLRIVFLLALWISTVTGGILFFVVNGLDYMSGIQILLVTGIMGTATNFYIVVLPMLLLLGMNAGIDAAARRNIPNGPTPG